MNYYSKSQNVWYPATVAVADANGVQLDIAPGVVIPPSEYGERLQKSLTNVDLKLDHRVRFFV